MSSKAFPGVIHQSKDIFMPGPPSTSKEHPKLIRGTYLVGISPQGYYCERVEDMRLPKKLYGNTIPRAARIVKTFQSRQTNTGVLLAGQRGSGKSLLAKAISVLMLDDGVPTLLINQPFTGDAFAQFLSALNTPFVALLDEFEKVYDAEDQEKLLTLLDGVHSSRALYLLTCNKTHKVDENFINRPSRIFYNLHYKGMEIEAIRELAQDTLNDKKKVEEITKLSSLFNDEMNFDMVQSAIEEVNRYPDEKLSELMQMMNLRPNNMAATFNYKATLQVAGKTYSDEGVYPREPRLSIFAFANFKYYIRDGFSDEEREAGAGVAVKVGKASLKSEVAVGSSTSSLAAYIYETGEFNGDKAARKAAKKARRESQDSASDETKYNKNRATLGTEYDDVWDEWHSDFTYRDKPGNVKEFTFSNRQMKGSDPKKGTYTFVSDNGAVLTLTRINAEEFGTSDYYNML